MSRPHAAAIIEDAFNEQVERILRGRGWGNRVITHIGYGTSTYVRVFARIVLGRRGHAGPPERQDATGALAPRRYNRGWRVFVTAPAAFVMRYACEGLCKAWVFDQRSIALHTRCI